MTDTPTPPPPASDPIDAAIIRYSLDTGFCDEKSMRAAIAAYHATLPSAGNLLTEFHGAANQFQFYADEHVKKGSYDKASTNITWSRKVRAAITALEARLADAYERCAKVADDIAAEWPEAPTGRHDDWRHGRQDGAMEVAAAIREVK
jgi:hypothetical protein